MKDLDLQSIKPMLKKAQQATSKHAPFAIILLILFTYLFVVWRISQLSNAEPSPDDSGATTTTIPKIDKNAVKQIESLEENSPDLHSLFNDARNNPFQE